MTLRISHLKLTVAVITIAVASAFLSLSASSWQALGYPTNSPSPTTVPLREVTTAGRAADQPDGYQVNPYRLTESAPLCVNPTGAPYGEDLVRAFSDAISIWKSSAPGLPIELAGTCDDTAVSGDGRFVAGWAPLDGTVVGRTQIRYYNGVINEFDIRIDSSNPTLADPDCLLRVVVHELGHSIGLAHQTDPSSVMYPITDCAQPVLPQPVLPQPDAQAAWALYD